MKIWKEWALAIVLITAVVVLIITSMFFIGQIAQPIKHGTYEGQTIDYSHQRGFIFTTNDLTTKTHERSSQRETWCVPDNRPDLIDTVRSIPEGAEVKIVYYRPLFIWPDTCAGQLKVIENIRVTNPITNGS